MVTMNSESYGGDFHLTYDTMHADLYDKCLKYPNNIALVSMHQPQNLYAVSPRKSDEYLRWTYTELHNAAENFAIKLRKAGIKKGDAIASIVPNGAEYILLFLAALRLRCPFVPLSPRNLPNVLEVEHMLTVTNVQAIFVGDAGISKILESSLPLKMSGMILKVSIGNINYSPSWTSMSTLMDEEFDGTSALDLDMSLPEQTDIALVIFTSGTTSLPKACAHTHQNFEFNLQSLDTCTPEIDQSAIVCNVSPNNHLIGIFVLLWALRQGGTNVYPAPGFSSKDVLNAFAKEDCTDLGVVPAMVIAILQDIQSGEFAKPKNLKRVTLGGTNVTVDMFRNCREGLGAQSFRLAYGMSEGTPLVHPYKEDPEVFRRGDNASSGIATPGVRIRICAPNSQKPVPIGELGELHQSGPHMMQGYIGKDRSSDWYTDAQGEWFRTGDQAIMGKDGHVCVVGRYKDIIIRGGENVSPAVIESVLCKTPGIEAYVVPAPDIFAGEVPVAIVKASTTFSAKALQDAVLHHLGASFVPDSILTLADLNLKEFPKTLSGKIQKTELTRLVRQLRNSRNEINTDNLEVATSQATVLRLWARLLGIKPEELDTESPIQHFADSITIMRFRDMLQRETGKSLSTAEMKDNPTIESQVELINHKPKASKAGTVSPVQAPVFEREGPPKAEDMIHAAGDEFIAAETRKAVEGILKPLQMDWKDVGDVTPAYDQAFVLFKNRRLQSWGQRCAVLPKVNKKQIRRALEHALRRYPIIHSFLVRMNEGKSTEEALFVTMRPTEAWFNHIIKEQSSVELVGDLNKYALRDPKSNAAPLPGPLLQVHMVHVKETDSYGLVLNMNHTTYDALAMRLFFDDLDAALGNPEVELPAHESYKLWSDTYYALRTSKEAQTAVKWHVDRLSGLASHADALFPHQGAPEWLIGDSNEGWTISEADKKKGFSNPERKNLNEKCCTDELDFGDVHRFQIPSPKPLYEELPQLTGPVIFKTALALFNSYKTKQDHALFSSLEANRSEMPFVPRSMAQRLNINCAHVAGPLYERVVDLIDIHADESTLDMLQRLQEQQFHLTKLAAAPMREIIKGLGTNDDGTASGNIYEDVLRRQIINWVPGLSAMASSSSTSRRTLHPSEMATQSVNYRAFKPYSRTDEGFIWICGMGGPTGAEFYIKPVYDDAQVRKEEADAWAEELGRIVAWLVEGANWGRKAVEFAECLA